MGDVLFDQRFHKPTASDLHDVLGRARVHWDAILEHAREVVDGLRSEWKFYGRSYGWTFKLSNKKRAVLYLTPSKRCFTAAMSLRESAAALLRERRLPEALVAEIENGPKYPEGRPARVRVGARRDVSIVKKLLALKLEP